MSRSRRSFTAEHKTEVVNLIVRHNRSVSDVCREMDLVPSAVRHWMSRRGNCRDNAVVESFFATLKIECIRDERLPTRAYARTLVFGYIEGFYNTRRRHSFPGYASPADYDEEQLSAQHRALNQLSTKPGKVHRDHTIRLPPTRKTRTD